MNWPAMHFDWNQIRAFLATVEEGSLSAAARALGQSQPTLSRQISALEADLGIALFERVGRGLEITPSGLDLVEHVRAMGDAATRISLAASGRNHAIAGKVRITASDALAAHVLPPALAHIRAKAPGIELEIVATNALSDLRRREADIALRHQRPTEPDLIARLIHTSRASLYAAPSYLARIGTPVTAQDLADADFIGFDGSDRLLDGLTAIGIPATQASFPLKSESGTVAWEMVRKGLGIGVMMDEVAAACPDVMRVLPDLPGFEIPVWLTTHRELHTSRRIRLVYDALAATFAPSSHINL
ncbi:MAG: LysR family transcriptional regulator [Roseovarius sp.]|uniref:LysR family transcriptional regulator n=1 Tax=Roseovarius sp. TaxID=1486281 RepID=UPI0032EB75AC